MLERIADIACVLLHPGGLSAGHVVVRVVAGADGQFVEVLGEGLLAGDDAGVQGGHDASLMFIEGAESPYRATS
jgi:hypothetical protein